MGFVQWLVLRRHVLQAGGWVLASSLGFFVVGAMFGLLSGAVSEAVNEIVHNVVGGAVAGTIQWRILRRQMRGAWWWIPASSIAFLVAGGVSSLSPGVPLSEVVGILAMAAITGGV